jgi:hypothetical protein
MSATSPPPLMTSSTRSMKTNVFTSPRTEEFGEESKQQKLFVGLLVMDTQVHLDINGGHCHLHEVDLFYGIVPN